jgi:two-component system LytT family response regulator
VNRCVRVLIADDEKPARQRLVALLRGRPEIGWVGECMDGEALLRMLTDAVISCARIDILFLDVQMPPVNGVDLFKALADESPDAAPVVVFVTADDTHVRRALQIGAADYLLKPFSDERFETALQRALRLVPAFAGANQCTPTHTSEG